MSVAASMAGNWSFRQHWNGTKFSDPGIPDKEPALRVTGASRFNDPARFPWTMGVIASYETEGKICGKYILRQVKDAKVAVLYQNDDLGREYFKGLQEGLGDQAQSMTVKSISYEITDPTLGARIIALRASGANVLLNASSPNLPRSPFAKRSISTGIRPIFWWLLEAPSQPPSLQPAL
jgi:branched-chain amino acid transport system substrate-binding protein